METRKSSPDKKEIRKKHLAIRNAMSEPETAEKSRAICEKLLTSDWYGSRPLHGVLLSQYCPLHLLKHRAFIPHLRGKPANERNLNIKLVYNIHKA